MKSHDSNFLGVNSKILTFELRISKPVNSTDSHPYCVKNNVERMSNAV